MIVHLGDKADAVQNATRKIHASPPAAERSSPIPDGKDHLAKLQTRSERHASSGASRANTSWSPSAKGEMQALVKRAFGKTPAWLTDITEECGRGADFDGRVCERQIDPANRHGLENAARCGEEVLEALGITNLKNVSVIAGLDKTGFVSKTTFAFDGPAAGLVRIRRRQAACGRRFRARARRCRFGRGRPA